MHNFFTLQQKLLTPLLVSFTSQFFEVSRKSKQLAGKELQVFSEKLQLSQKYSPQQKLQLFCQPRKSCSFSQGNFRKSCSFLRGQYSAKLQLSSEKLQPFSGHYFWKSCSFSREKLQLFLGPNPSGILKSMKSLKFQNSGNLGKSRKFI